MEKLVGCCGFKCHSCTANSANIKTEADRKLVSHKWKEYYAYDIAPEQLQCRGCRADDSVKEYMLHADCEFRNCALGKGLASCKACSTYPCANLREYVEAYQEAYQELAPRLSQADAAGYFLCYTTALEPD